MNANIIDNVTTTTTDLISTTTTVIMDGLLGNNSMNNATNMVLDSFKDDVANHIIKLIKDDTLVQVFMWTVFTIIALLLVLMLLMVMLMKCAIPWHLMTDTMKSTYSSSMKIKDGPE